MYNSSMTLSVLQFCDHSKNIFKDYQGGKDIEKYYDFKRTGDILKGDISEEFYIQWIQNNDQQLLDKIEEYNTNNKFQIKFDGSTYKLKILDAKKAFRP